MNLLGISLSPMDCLSVHYFLFSIKTVASGQIDLDLPFCSIDDQCLGMLLGITTEHAETSFTLGVLEPVKIPTCGEQQIHRHWDCLHC